MTKYEILKTTSFSSIFYIQSKHIENGFYQKVLLLLMLNYKNGSSAKTILQRKILFGFATIWISIRRAVFMV